MLLDGGHVTEGKKLTMARPLQSLHKISGNAEGVELTLDLGGY